MRTGDVWLGAALLLAGLAILVVARGFPTMAGLPYGPGLFPSIAAVGLAACGALIALGGWRGGARSRSRVEPGTGGAGEEGAPDPKAGGSESRSAAGTERGEVAGGASFGAGVSTEPPALTESERAVGGRTAPGGALPTDGALAGMGKARLLPVAVVPLSVVFFGLALDGLGFHVTAVLALTALFLAFGLGPVRAGAFALVAAFVIHGVFYSLLRVPLPWGVLTPVAW